MPNGDLNLGEGELVQTEDKILQMVDAGNSFRRVAETKMNVESSRSHAILQIVSWISSVQDCNHKHLSPCQNEINKFLFEGNSIG